MSMNRSDGVRDQEGQAVPAGFLPEDDMDCCEVCAIPDDHLWPA